MNASSQDDEDSVSSRSSDRLKSRERAVRHRERLQRAKQYHSASSATPNKGTAGTPQQSPVQQRRSSEDPSQSDTRPRGSAQTSRQTQMTTQQLARNSNSNSAAQSPRKSSGAAQHKSSTSNATLSSTFSRDHQHTMKQQTSKSGPVLVSVESPLPPLVQRSLGDRSYDKRKNAALEIEQLVKSLNEAHNVPMIQSIISILAKDFCTSMNANYRKGGLIGIAATSIGLMGNTRSHLEGLLFPVLHCFDDPESRVRYYACESLYNIAKVARGSILRYFNQIFDGLTKLFADVDVDVKNGANLLDRLIKDIVTESESFHVEHFLPLLTTYIKRTNPYIRQLLVGWITVLDSVPDISMIDYLPDFLDGLFNMLSDSNREIRQAADSQLSDFLKEVRHSTVLEFGPLVSILVSQSLSKDRLNRLTAITWIQEIIHHPHSGGDALLPHHADVLGAILYCISDSEEQISLVAERTNADLLSLVRDTRGDFRLSPLLSTLTDKFMTKDDVATKMASLRWINMLMEKRRGDMTEFVPQLMPVLLKTLSDASDTVVLFTLQVLARISLGDGGVGLEDDNVALEDPTNEGGLLKGTKDEKHFRLVVNSVLGLFSSDRILLENRGSLVVRKLCVLLDSESVYILIAQVLSASCDASEEGAVSESVEKGPSKDQVDSVDRVSFSVEFVSTMVQTLNLILLTANELHGLRFLLSNALGRKSGDYTSVGRRTKTDDPVRVFEILFRCWCHSPVATFSLCLLARAYGIAFALVKKFSEIDVTVGKSPHCFGHPELQFTTPQVS